VEYPKGKAAAFSSKCTRKRGAGWGTSKAFFQATHMFVIAAKGVSEQIASSEDALKADFFASTFIRITIAFELHYRDRWFRGYKREFTTHEAPTRIILCSRLLWAKK